MKRLFLFFIAITFTLSLTVFPRITKGQEGYRRDWVCCKCQKWWKHDFPKDRTKMGLCHEPECNILCDDCSKELGNLEKALEELKQKNRDLNILYQKKTAELD